MTNKKKVPMSVEQAARPDPEVAAVARRRQFSSTDKRRILDAADRCTQPGETGALLRQEGIYSSHSVHLAQATRSSGTLWEGRFRSCLMQDETYVLACYRYIELNPVRTGMVAHPAEYRWSSYRANVQGEANTLLMQHSVYLALGRAEAGAETRLAAYRELFARSLSDLKNRSEISAGRGQFLSGSPGNSRTIAQEAGEKWTVPPELQPISLQVRQAPSDRLAQWLSLNGPSSI